MLWRTMRLAHVAVAARMSVVGVSSLTSWEYYARTSTRRVGRDLMGREEDQMDTVAGSALGALAVQLRA